MTLFQDATRKLGYHPYPVPAATLSRPYRNPDGVARTGCAYCGYCERFGCMIGAKAQPTNTLVPVLARHKNFTLRPGCWARRITVKSGRATGVEYTAANGEEFFQPAETVMLASFTLNNVRLLYLSKIGTPYDVTSGKGTLGRNLTHQILMPLNVFFNRPMNAFMGSGALGIAISDHDGMRSSKGMQGILRGGSFLGASTGNRPIQTFGAMPPETTKASWGSEWKKNALAWRDKVVPIVFYGEHMSYRSNFMDLDPTYTDKFGDPLLRFTLDWTPHEQQQRTFGAGIVAEIARAMGAVAHEGPPSKAKYSATQYQSTHVQGGAVMGVTPERGVVNTHLQHWDVPNLWVIGASSFPQNASFNPTMTALAVTYRAADAFLDRYLKHPGSLV
jgi:gluconate 2-dehydrogenase alpha chain